VHPEAQGRWVAEVRRRLADTVWERGGCRSWYRDAQGRNTTLWPGHTFEFRRRLARFDADSYALLGGPAARPALSG